MRRIQEDSVLSLRLAPEEAQLLKQEAEARGTSVSKVARRAIASGLKPVRMQSRRISYALGSRSPDVDLGVATFGGSTDWGATSSTAVTLRLG